SGRGRPALHALFSSTYYFTLPHYDVSRRRVRIKALGWRPQKAVHAGRAHDAQAEGERQAYIAKAAARPFAGRNPPLRGEQPQAVAEMPGSGDDAERVEGDHPWIVELRLHLGKCQVGMRRQVDAGEA